MSESFTVLPLSPIRRMIAARTAEAKQTIPHFRLREDIEVDAVVARRGAIEQGRGGRPEPGRGERLSLNDVLIKACADALVATPALNLQWVDGELRHLHSVDISVVVALEEGLATPIVRRAEEKSVWEISREIRALTVRARQHALKIDEILGGSFSVSNLGMYGVPEFDAIINPPKCAILAIGAARKCVVPGNGLGSRIASLMRVTLSCDHRAIDGATGAAFLSALKLRLEDPEHLRRMTEAT